LSWFGACCATNLWSTYLKWQTRFQVLYKTISETRRVEKNAYRA
jgi:hypothetical protein